MYKYFTNIFVICLLIAEIPVFAAETRDTEVLRYSLDSLKQAIEDLAEKFPQQYPSEFKSQLENLAYKTDDQVDAFVRKALLANPLVSGQPLLFVVRPPYRNVHGTEETMCQVGELALNGFVGGGAMKLLDVSTGQTRTLLEAKEGIIRDPEVHFDGRKILFSMRHDKQDGYHLYEIDTDGGNLRQLTFGDPVSDIQPLYMPDGGIVFSSTRDPKYIPCNNYLMANLFRVDADGSNLRQLGFNTQFEGRSSLMPDGRILYTRWEYVDKHYSSAYGLWTVNPDGTNHALYYGNYAWQPGAILDAKIIPGTQQFVAIYGSVHTIASGAMVVANRSVGLDGLDPIRYSWPRDITPQMNEWDVEERIGNRFDSFAPMPIKYEDPHPLSDTYFLCVRQLSKGKHMGIYLIDTFGNEVLIREEAPGCYNPVPLKSYPRPPIIPSRIDESKDSGQFYVENVYVGDYMDRVKPGTVKYLRVVEAPSKRTWAKTGKGDWTPPGSPDSHHPVATNWTHYNHKRILGTVPVETDGSAYFTVPAGKFVYFQLLDENGMMIHSMRSGTMLQPGEVMGCIGCHEERLGSPTTAEKSTLKAMKRAPTPMKGWYGPERNFSYAAEVQPVLDRNCISCHDFGGKAEKLNLSGDKELVFNYSYTNLMRLSPSYYKRAEHEQNEKEKLPLVSSVGAGPVKILPPYSWGSHRSRLVKMLQEGHKDLKLDAESMDRIITWIDLNAPYYPSHASYYSGNTAGRSPINHQQLLELGQLVSQSPNGSEYGWSKVNEYANNQFAKLMGQYGPLMNFTRPEYSFCLQGFEDKNSDEYQRALELIRLGQRNMQQHPRADMPGFVPSQFHQKQLQRVASYQLSMPKE